MLFSRSAKLLSAALILSTAAILATPSSAGATNVAERCDWRGCAYIHCNYTGDRCYRVDRYRHGYGYRHRHRHGHHRYGDHHYDGDDCDRGHSGYWRERAYRRYGDRYDRYDDESYQDDWRDRDRDWYGRY